MDKQRLIFKLRLEIAAIRKALRNSDREGFSKVQVQMLLERLGHLYANLVSVREILGKGKEALLQVSGLLKDEDPDDNLLLQSIELIESGAALIKKGAPLVDPIRWLTIVEYSKKYGVKPQALSAAIEKGAIIKDDYVLIGNAGREFLKDKFYSIQLNM